MLFWVAWLCSPPSLEQLVQASEVAEFDVSPDGTQVVFAWNRLGDWDIFSVPLAGGDPELLVGEAGDERAPRFSSDGRMVMFVRQGANEVWGVDAAGGDIQPVLGAQTKQYLARIGRKTAVFRREDAQQPGSLYVEGSTLRLLVRGAPELDRENLAAAVAVDIRRSDSDGSTFSAWLYQRRPEHAGRAVIVLRDQAKPKDGSIYDPLAQALLGQGIAVLDLTTDDWAGADVMMAARWLVDEAVAAPGRIGVMGRGLVGGYLALMAAARNPQMLTAVATVGGAVDLFEWGKRADRQVRGSVERKLDARFDEAEWLARSPISYLSRFRAALLIYGADDPQSGSARAFQAALERQGSVAPLLVFDGEKEQLTWRRHRIEALRAIVDFMIKRL